MHGIFNLRVLLIKKQLNDFMKQVTYSFLRFPTYNAVIMCNDLAYLELSHTYVSLSENIQKLLNQVYNWFLEIVFVRNVRMCVCVFAFEGVYINGFFITS